MFGLCLQECQVLVSFLHAILSDSLYVAPHRLCPTELFHGQNTSCAFQQQEAGVIPEARRDRGRDFAARWGRSVPIVREVGQCDIALHKLRGPKKGKCECGKQKKSGIADTKADANPDISALYIDVKYCYIMAYYGN